MIAVTFALPAESSAFIRLLKGVRRDGVLLLGNIERRTPNAERRTPNIKPLRVAYRGWRGEMRRADRQFSEQRKAGTINRQRILRRNE